MRVEFHPSTAEDVNEAARRYRRIRPGLDSDFRSEIVAVVERIGQNPELYPVVASQTRRCIVRRFPYSVLFRIVDPDCVRILVIRHHRRHPRFGLKRT
jgi:plasmid stabilization system protein ParE